jgi:hypothetical protein
VDPASWDTVIARAVAQSTPAATSFASVDPASCDFAQDRAG